MQYYHGNSDFVPAQTNGFLHVKLMFLIKFKHVKNLSRCEQVFYHQTLPYDGTRYKCKWQNFFFICNINQKKIYNVSLRRIISFLHAFRVLMLCTSLLTSLLQLENCFSLLWNITWLVMMKNVHFVHFSCNIFYPHSTSFLLFFILQFPHGTFFHFTKHSSYWVFFPHVIVLLLSPVVSDSFLLQIALTLTLNQNASIFGQI